MPSAATDPPPLTREQMLDRASARDRAFDSVFLTCVRTTGIYCLPSCRARSPKPENVEHARTPAEARARGFRPCKRCRPDDHHAGRDGDRDGLLRALTALRAAPGDFDDVAAFARATGCGATKLLLLCRKHLHRAPADVLLAARLHHARRELAGTRRRVLDIALDCGFQGSSAFHANFRAHTGMSPRAFRTMGDATGFALQLPPGHPTAACFAYHGRDADSLSERVLGPALHLALRFADRAGVLTLVLRRGSVHATVAMADGRAPGRAAMLDAHTSAVRLLRLDCDPAAGERVLRRDAALRPWLQQARGLRPWATATPFDCLLFAILGQQVHLAFAQQMRRDLTRRAGQPVGALVAQPTAAAIADLDAGDLRAVRSSQSKGATVLTAARAIADGDLDLDALGAGSAEAAAQQLLALRGIGPWTTQYLLMRGLGFLDCAPTGDSALAAAAQRIHGLIERPDAGELAALLLPCAPYRSLASFHLWRVFATPALPASPTPRPAHRRRTATRPG